MNHLQFEEAWGRSQMSGDAAKGWVHKALNSGRAGIESLDVRLGLGALVLNWMMFKGSLSSYQDVKTGDVGRAVAVCGMVDAGAGVLGGIATILEGLMTAAFNMDRGHTAIRSLQLFGSVVGIVGGAANGVMNLLRAKEAGEAEQTAAMWFYRASSGAFWGVFGAFGRKFLGGAAVWATEKLVIRGLAGKVVQGIALRWGSPVAQQALGRTGAWLLLAAVGFEVCVALAKPNELQQWTRRTQFGNNRKKFTSWEEESEELVKVLDPAAAS